MFYLGPIQRRLEPPKTPARPTSVTPVNPYAQDQKHETLAGVGPVVGAPGGVERRKSDRRSNSRNPMVETRAGRDRRRASQVEINISI